MGVGEGDLGSQVGARNLRELHLCRKRESRKGRRMQISDFQSRIPETMRDKEDRDRARYTTGCDTGRTEGMTRGFPCSNTTCHDVYYRRGFDLGLDLDVPGRISVYWRGQRRQRVERCVEDRTI